GPWSDPHWLGFEGIDPSIHWDESGKAYIVNNGAPNEEPRYDGHRAIWIQEFDYKNLTMVGERKQLINGGVDILPSLCGSKGRTSSSAMAITTLQLPRAELASITRKPSSVQTTYGVLTSPPTITP